MNINELLDECDKSYANKDFSRLNWACSSILEEDKTNETALTYQLYVYCDWRQYHLVFRIANQIRRLYPENYHAYNAEAIVHMEKNEFKEALQCCEEGLKISDYYWLRKNKIEALISLNRIEEAREFYNNSQIPDYDFTKALINCTKFSEITHDKTSDSELVGYMLYKCREFDRKSKHSEVLKVCDEILKIDKENENALVYKVHAMAFLGRDDELLKYLNYGIRLYPENPMFYLLKAETIQLDLDETIDLYEKGLALCQNPKNHWYHIDELVFALHDKADELSKAGKYDEAVVLYDKILYYKNDDFKALDRLDELVSQHNLRYEHTQHYDESFNLRINARKRLEKIDDCLGNIVVGEYDEDYINGCSEFKDYKSLDEYIRDIIIVLMEAYPCHSEQQARFLVKCDMECIKSAYEQKEPADYCAIGVGYCCG